MVNDPKEFGKLGEDRTMLSSTSFMDIIKGKVQMKVH